MKKKILLIVFLSFIVLALVLVLVFGRRGGGQKEALPLADAARAALSDYESLTAYDGEEFFDIVGVSPDDYTEFCYRTGENDIGLVAREVILVRAKDAEALARVKAALEQYHARRENETRSYAPDIFAMLEKSKVTVKGNTAVLIIGDSSAAETSKFLTGE